MSYSDVILATSGLISYWRLGETGASAADSNGANTGTYTNSPTQGVAGALVGDSDLACTFAGASTQYVTMGDPADGSLDPGDAFSIEAWFKQASTSAGVNRVIAAKGGSSAQGWGLRLSTTNLVVFYGVGPGGTNWRQTSAISDLNWHYVVATKNGATAEIYVDGSLASGASLGNQTVTNNTNPFNVAASFAGTGEPFTGTIDEVAFYNRVLTSTEAADHYASGTGTTPPPTPTLQLTRSILRSR